MNRYDNKVIVKMNQSASQSKNQSVHLPTSKLLADCFVNDNYTFSAIGMEALPPAAVLELFIRRLSSNISEV